MLKNSGNASKGGKSFKFNTEHGRDDSTSGTAKKAGLKTKSTDNLSHSISASEGKGYGEKKNTF